MRVAPPMCFPGRTPAEVERFEHEWWRAIVQRVVAEAGLGERLSGTRFDAYFKRLYEHFATGDAWQVYPDVVPSLSALKDGGFAVGVITNYDTRVRRVLDDVGLSPWIGSVIIPATAGAAKPSRAIFASALDTAGVPPSCAVHVGDSLEEDYDGARAAGLNGVLLDRDGRHGRARDVVRVASLAELMT